MIQIKINGQVCDVELKPAVVEWVNPHLLYDGIAESVVQLPNFPFSARNQKAFGYWEETQVGGAVPSYYFEYVYAGELLHEGVFALKEASQKNGYVGAAQEVFSYFFGDYQRKLLTEIDDFGTLPLTEIAGVHTNLGTAAYCLPTVINMAYYADKGASIGYTGKVNDYAGGGYLTSNTPRVPFFFVKWILKKLALITNVTIEGSFLEHPAFGKLVIVNLTALDGASEVTVKRHLPELTVENFLLELRKIPNLKFVFDPVRKHLQIDFWEDDLLLPATADWSEKGLTGEVKVSEPNPRLGLAYKLDSADALAKDKPALLADYSSPTTTQVYTGIATITTAFSTTLVDSTTGLAEVRQEGVTVQFEQLSKKVAPRLLFWNGIQNGYPRALPSLGGYSLYWHGNQGLQAKCWKQLELLRAGQFYLKKDFHLNEIDLAKFDFARKIHCNGVDYLVASLIGELPITKPFSALLIACP